MSPDTERLFETVQALSTDERVEFIDALISGLDSHPQLDESTWQEIRRRSAEYDDSKRASVPWSAVRRRGRS